MVKDKSQSLEFHVLGLGASECHPLGGVLELKFHVLGLEFQFQALEFVLEFPILRIFLTDLSFFQELELVLLFEF